MIQRLFKLLYTFTIIALVISCPAYLLSEIRFDAIVWTTYKARCLSNDQYVVLQGSPLDQVYTFDELTLNDTIYNDTKRSLNFYCKYYDAIQPHINAYINAKTNQEIVGANGNFWEFREEVINNIFAYPELYKLEEVDKEFRPYEIFEPIIAWIVMAGLAFILLQIVRMSYVYVVFSEIVWHPFKQRKNKLHEHEN